MSGHRSAVLCLNVSNRMMYTGGADSAAKGWIKEFGECKGHGVFKIYVPRSIFSNERTVNPLISP